MKGLRRVVSLLVAGAMVASLSAVFAAPAAAAVACTSSSPGYHSKAKTTSWNPPNAPTVSLTGQIWQKWCNDGAGFSVWYRTLSSASKGGPYTLSSDRLESWYGDDCGIWEHFGPATLFNVSSFQDTAGWHWQPLVVCGPNPTDNHGETRSTGRMVKNGLFDYTWNLSW